MNDMLQDQLDSLFITLRNSPEYHTCLSPQYQEMKTQARDIFNRVYDETGIQSANLLGIGEVRLPFFSMGNISSVNLFDLDELIIFSFYCIEKGRYNIALDVGANIGLHSIIMAKLGLSVTAFEPDPIHFNRLLVNNDLNHVSTSIHPIKSAVSRISGKAEFTRVLGNTTGSHLSTAKSSAYGDLEKFEVDVVGINNYAVEADFIKLDAEGEELNILKGIKLEAWDALDIMAEVGNEHNSHEIFQYLEQIDVKIYSQKIKWQQVTSPAHMPKNYKEGSVFISRHNITPWTN